MQRGGGVSIRLGALSPARSLIQRVRRIPDRSALQSLVNINHPRVVSTVRVLDEMPRVFRREGGDRSGRGQGRLHGGESNQLLCSACCAPGPEPVV